MEAIICTPFFQVLSNRSFFRWISFKIQLIEWVKRFFAFNIVDDSNKFIGNGYDSISFPVWMLNKFPFVVFFKGRRESPTDIGSIIEGFSQIGGTSLRVNFAIERK